MKNLKKFLGAAAVLLLAGAGCGAKTDTQIDVTPPVAEPAEPATPPTPPGQPGAEPAEPATPPVIDIDADVSLKAGVTITAGGTFSPATLTVKKGTTVTWTNSGSAKVWVASDPHPVHTGYAGLDSRTDLGAGESFSFTFDKVGSWGYHNHLNSTVKGTVVVTE
jgi:plastocyanin